MEQLTGEIHKVGALPINPGSGDQIARPLFHHIGLESFKLTQKKTREAVDVKVMESLRATHPVIPLILDYTERKQLRNVYTAKLPGWVDEDGRIRATFRITRIPSGGLACSEPSW